jgi:hypothetical protein
MVSTGVIQEDVTSGDDKDSKAQQFPASQVYSEGLLFHKGGLIFLTETSASFIYGRIPSNHGSTATEGSQGYSCVYIT